jgi:hypothetical protein
MDDNLKNRLDALRALLDGVEADAAKNDEGVLAAGGRVRKQLQELKRLAQEARVFCLERDHSRKVK